MRACSPTSRPRTRRNACGAASRLRWRCLTGCENGPWSTAGSIGDVKCRQGESLRARSGQEPGQLRALDAAGIHRARRPTWAETYARCRRLASALARRGIGVGDTVAVMLANTPEMLECHFGVPMAGAVLNTLNTRLDAEAIAFMLEHGGAKVLITDREFSGTVARALSALKVKPCRIDVDDPEYSGAGERIGQAEYESFIAGGDPEFPWQPPV